MTRLVKDPYLPKVDSPAFITRLYDVLRGLTRQLNGISEGQITAITNATIAAPTSGTYQQGDKIWHSAPVEAGAPGSKYVTIGFICTVAGTPGTWLPMRVLTGN